MNSQNSFEGGLLMDVHPLSTTNSVLTNCLNGTFLTFNGNEYILQNDMGNGRVETAALPTGYVPLGTTSFGGIIYIVSLNPHTNKCLIGCFPSPERNIDPTDTLSELATAKITNSDFVDDNNKITNRVVKIKLSDIKLNPGDKYAIAASGLNSDISDYLTTVDNPTIGCRPLKVRLRVATTDSSGKLVYIDSNIKWYKRLSGGQYYMLDNIENVENNVDAYKATVGSQYSIFNSKLSGELYLVAQLEIIDTFGYSYSTVKNDDGTLKLTFLPEWTSNNWNDSKSGIDPKWIKVTDLFDNSNTYLDLFKEENDKEVSTSEIVNDIRRSKCEYDSTFNKKDVFNFSIIPCMKYGEIQDLTIRDSIDFSLIGTGSVEVTRWQYYVSNDYTLLRYGIQANPEIGYKFTGLKMEFYSIFQLKNADNFTGDTSKITPAYTYTNTGRSSYSGVFNIEIPNDNLPINDFYVVKICLQYGKSSEESGTWKDPIIKTIFTSDIFNEYYIDDGDNYQDFTKLYLKTGSDDSILNYSINLTSDLDNIQCEGEIQYPDNLQSQITDADQLKNQTLGYTNYNLNSKFNVYPSVSFNSDLFSANPNINVNLVDVDSDGKSEIVPTITHETLVNTSITDDETVLKDVLKSGNLIVKKESDGRYLATTSAQVGIYSNLQQKKSINYKGRFIPLLYSTEDLDTYGLSIYDQGNKRHFYYDQITAISGDGYLDIHSYKKDTNGLEKEVVNIYDAGQYIECGHDGEHYWDRNLMNKSDDLETKIITFFNERFPDLTMVPFIITTGQAHYWNEWFYWIDNKDSGYYGNTNYGLSFETNRDLWQWDQCLNRKSTDDPYAELYVYHYNFDGITPQTNINSALSKCVKLNKAQDSYTGTKNSSGAGCTTFGLFIKSTQGTYLLANNFAIQNGGDNNYVERLGGTDFSIPDVIASFLMQTYKYDSEEVTIEEYRPSEVVYLPSFTEKYSIKFSAESTLNEDDIKFLGNSDSGISLRDIKALLKLIDGKDYTDSDSIAHNMVFSTDVINYKQIEFGKTVESNLEYNLTASDKLYNTYTSDYVNDVIILNNVNKLGIEKSFTLNNTVTLNSNKLYTLDYDTNKMYELSNIPTINEKVYSVASNYKKDIPTINCYNMITFDSDRLSSNGRLVAKYNENDKMNPYGLQYLQLSDGKVTLNQTKFTKSTKRGIQGKIERGKHNTGNDYVNINNIGTDMSFSKHLTCYYN